MELQNPMRCFQELKVTLTAKRFHFLAALPSINKGIFPRHAKFFKFSKQTKIITDMPGSEKKQDLIPFRYHRRWYNVHLKCLGILFLKFQLDHNLRIKNIYISLVGYLDLGLLVFDMTKRSESSFPFT